MPGRKFLSDQKYRYGFKNQEEDPELWGGAVSYKYRIEDPRLGRFFSVDPLSNEFPWNSPYAFSENRVIDGIELEGLEVFLIHGTRQNNSDVYSENTVDQFKVLGGNSYVDRSFSWGSHSKLTNSRDVERKTSAIELAIHVFKIRKQLIKDKKITENEPITLAGYSHGGNVAIQASKLIKFLTGKKVKLITVATPAYNDGSSEDPSKSQDAIEKHWHFYSKADGVDGIAGGNETYTNSSTLNIEIPEKYIKNEGTIDTHSNMGNKNKNSGIGNYIKDLLEIGKNKK